MLWTCVSWAGPTDATYVATATPVAPARRERAHNNSRIGGRRYSIQAVAEDRFVAEVTVVDGWDAVLRMERTSLRAAKAALAEALALAI